MKIDCNDTNVIKDIWFSHDIIGKGYGFVGFVRGSALYGTYSDESDVDIGIIVPDDTEFIDIEGVFDNEKCDTRIHPSVVTRVLEKGENSKDVDIDCQFVRRSDFIDMIKEHTPFALEALGTNAVGIEEYREYFTLDVWQLRKSFGGVANNSWSKAHKKMTVDKDLDVKCGVKSLFHSIRLQEFACQIAQYNIFIDFKSCKSLWEDIKKDWENGYTWEDFKSKYKPIYNEWHSEMVKLCPKPESEYKSAKR